MELWTVFVGPAVTLAVCFIGGLIGYGKMKASMVTIKDCRNSQDVCQGKVLDEVKELKDLVIELHDKQTAKVDALDKKRHDMNNANQKLFMDINKQLGTIDGYFKAKKVTIRGD